MEKLEYKGFMCDDTQEFFKDKIIKEEKNGCGIVGSFIKLSNGETHLPNKGDIFTKDNNGNISVKSKHR